jgi:hypothetical protein
MRGSGGRQLAALVPIALWMEEKGGQWWWLSRMARRQSMGLAVGKTQIQVARGDSDDAVDSRSTRAHA